jgi:hypothetical protein
VVRVARGAGEERLNHGGSINLSIPLGGVARGKLQGWLSRIVDGGLAQKTRAVDRMTEPPSQRNKMAHRRVLEIMTIWRGTGSSNPFRSGGESAKCSRESLLALRAKISTADGASMMLRSLRRPSCSSGVEAPKKKNGPAVTRTVVRALGRMPAGARRLVTESPLI